MAQKEELTTEQASAKILEVIEQSLPASSAEVIKSALNERDALRDECDRLTKAEGHLSKVNEDYYTRLNEATSKVRELTGALEETTTKLETANDLVREAKVNIAEGKLSAVQMTVDSFLRNVTVRRNINKNVSSMTPNPQYGGQANSNSNDTVTETEE